MCDWTRGAFAVVVVAVVVANAFFVGLLQWAELSVDEAAHGIFARVAHSSLLLDERVHDRWARDAATALATAEDAVRAMREHVSADIERAHGGRRIKLIVEAQNEDGGSCYGPCFELDRVGPETGCEYSCEFKKVDLGTSPDAGRADLVVHFFDQFWSEAAPRDPRRAKDQLLALYLGESAANYWVLANPKYTGMFNYSIGLHLRTTTWSHSGIQLPRLAAVLALTGPEPPVNYSTKRTRPAIAAWISNCNPQSGREQTLADMTAKTDGRLAYASYGTCLHNAEPWVSRQQCLKACPSWTGNRTNAWNNRQKVFISAHHLFTWAAENSNCDYYHTEKVFQALASGSVPVYFGAATIREVVPEHSTIIARDFPSSTELATYLLEVAENETKYNEWLAWRHRPIERRLVEMWENNLGPAKRPERHCNWCRIAHERPPGRVPPDTSCTMQMWSGKSVPRVPKLTEREGTPVIAKQVEIEVIPEAIKQQR
jgi:hypothetical protein